MRRSESVRCKMYFTQRKTFCMYKAHLHQPLIQEVLVGLNKTSKESCDLRAVILLAEWTKKVRVMSLRADSLSCQQYWQINRDTEVILLIIQTMILIWPRYWHDTDMIEIPNLNSSKCLCLFCLIISNFKWNSNMKRSLSQCCVFRLTCRSIVSFGAKGPLDTWFSQEKGN